MTTPTSDPADIDSPVSAIHAAWPASRWYLDPTVSRLGFFAHHEKFGLVQKILEQSHPDQGGVIEPRRKAAVALVMGLKGQLDEMLDGIRDALRSAPRPEDRWWQGSHLSWLLGPGANTLRKSLLESRGRQAALEFSEGLHRLWPDDWKLYVEHALFLADKDLHGIGRAIRPVFHDDMFPWLLAAERLGLPREGFPGIPAPSQERSFGFALRGQLTESSAGVIRLLRWLHPKAPIVVASWDTTPVSLLQEVGRFADTVATRPDPPVAGIQNRVRQMVLAKAALEAIEHFDCETVCLTRTDFVPLAPELAIHVQALLRRYPPVVTTLASRVIMPEYITRKRRPLHIADFLAIGAPQALKALWDHPTESALASGEMPFEQFLCAAFLKRLDQPIEWTESYWRDVLARHFVVRSWSGLGIASLKHANRPKDEVLATAFAERRLLDWSDACVTEAEWRDLVDGRLSSW